MSIGTLEQTSPYVGKPPIRSLRILNVHSGNLQGGIETALWTVARSSEFAPALKFDFALCFQEQFAHKLAQSGVKVSPLGEVRIRNPFSVMRARRQLRSLLSSAGYDFVICHSPWSQAIFGPAAKSVGVPSIYWAHDTVNGRRWLERWAGFQRPDFAICNSEFTQGSLNSMFEDIDSKVIHYPVATEKAFLTNKERQQIREEAQTSLEQIVIVQVSRMESWKGHANLIRALHHLKQNPSWILWLVGGAQRIQEANYANELKKLAENLAIAERVRFLGQRSDVANILSAADIFCQANAVAEPFGIVFVEALRAGLPVISFKMGGAEEIVDPACGFLVPPNDISKLSKALDQLISDPQLRNRMSKQAVYGASQICDPKSQMQQLEGLLLSLHRGGRSN